ncbi:GlcG/HbpS family heme-binding protein [Roseibium aggregatum]|uniref:Heme-binding protein n=1 Tax=Roseibium aggregatum TaxID=187304 RepID=A0A926S4Y4_9HYPH|nr:heme-binding protein [Roseibium aggregatum]MBD1545590.1 heme-binding protein [Roseibium aggregatum]
MTSEISQGMAHDIMTAAFAKAAEMGLKPLTVAVLDAGGHLKALSRQDGTSTLRPEIAQGKARGAISMGLGSRALFKRAQEQPYFIQSMNALSDGSLVPVPGGVLARNQAGKIIGAVGITGDSSDNDETCAIAGIEAVGLVADAG